MASFGGLSCTSRSTTSMTWTTTFLATTSMYYKVRFTCGSSVFETSPQRCTSSRYVTFTGSFSSLTPNTRYTCKVVILYNSTSNTSSSGTYVANNNVTTSASSLTYPAAPSSVSSSNITSSGFRLSWTRNSSNGSGATITYKIYIDSSPISGATTTGTSYTVSGLPYANTRYEVRVYATNEATEYDGYTGMYRYIYVTTINEAPGTPTGFSATKVSGYPNASSNIARVLLSWSGNSSGGNVSQYIVERKTSTGSYTTICTTTGATSCTDTSASPNTLYVYRVYATNSAGSSGYSNTSSVRTYASVVTNATYVRSTTTISVQVTCASYSGFYVTASNSSSANFVQPTYTVSGSTITITTESAPSVAVYLRIYSLNSENARDSLYYQITAIRTPPSTWSWSSSNGAATASQTSASKSCLDGKTVTSNFSYLVWNDLVSKLNEINEYSSLAWQNTYATSANTFMSSSDKTLTAVRFNSLTYNLQYTRRQVLGTTISHNAVSTGDRVYASYILDIATTLNTIIAGL